MVATNVGKIMAHFVMHVKNLFVIIVMQILHLTINEFFSAMDAMHTFVVNVPNLSQQNLKESHAVTANHYG
jgi:hypothetical protein